MWYKNIIYFRLTDIFRYNCDNLTKVKNPISVIGYIYILRTPPWHMPYPIFKYSHMWMWTRFAHIHIFIYVTYCFYWICYTIYYYIRIFEYVELWHYCNSVWFRQQDVRAGHSKRTKWEHTMSESGTNQLWEHMQNIRHFKNIFKK